MYIDVCCRSRLVAHRHLSQVTLKMLCERMWVISSRRRRRSTCWHRRLTARLLDLDRAEPLAWCHGALMWSSFVHAVPLCVTNLNTTALILFFTVPCWYCLVVYFVVVRWNVHDISITDIALGAFTPMVGWQKENLAWQHTASAVSICFSCQFLVNFWTTDSPT